MRMIRTATIGLLCVVLLTLTGCVKVDIDLEVHSDDTLSGTMILGVSKELPNAQQAVDQLNSDLPPNAVSEPWSDEQYVGVKVTYDDVPIEEFSTPTAGVSGDTGLGLRREGDFFIVGSPPDGTEPDGPDLSGLDPVYRLRLTFPGPVVDGNGVIDGNSIEWTDGNVTPYAKARASSVVLIPVLIAVGVVLILAAAALLVFLALRHHRASQQATPGQPEWSAPGHQPAQSFGTEAYHGQVPTQFTDAGTDPVQFTDPGASTPESPWSRPPDDPPPGDPSTPNPPGTVGDESPWQRPG